MDSLGDLLKQYSPQEPDEIAATKRYIFDEFGAKARVGLHGDALVITVDSAALANTLRLRLLKLQKAVNTTRKIIFRIS